MHDILCKSLGSANHINVARATIAGLKSLQRPDEVAARRGLAAEEFVPKGMLKAYNDRQRGGRSTSTDGADDRPDDHRHPGQVRHHAKPKTRGTLRALGLGRIGKTNTLPDRPEIRGMIARVRTSCGRARDGPIRAEAAPAARGGYNELTRDPGHDRPRPAPRAGRASTTTAKADRCASTISPRPPGRPRARKRKAPRHRRQGRQDRRPRHQGPAGPQHRPARLRRRPDAAQAAGAQAEGLQQPVPRRVPGRQPRHARRARRAARRPVDRPAGARRPRRRCARAPSSRSSPAAS